MTEFFFNIENMKMLFILAAGLYTWNFLRKGSSARNNLISQRKKKVMMEIQKDFQKINFEEYDGSEVFEIVKGFQEKCNTQGKDNKPHEKDEKSDPNFSALSQDPESIKRDNSTQDNEEDMITELNSMMIKYLLNQLSEEKSVAKLTEEWEEKHGKITNETGVFSDEEEVIQSEGKAVRKIKVRPCHQNVTKIEDSIAHIQVTTQDEDFEFFPPLRIESEMENEERVPILKKNIIVSNEEYLKAHNRLVPAVESEEEKQEQKNKTAKKKLIKKTRKIGRNSEKKNTFETPKKNIKIEKEILQSISGSKIEGDPFCKGLKRVVKTEKTEKIEFFYE